MCHYYCMINNYKYFNRLFYLNRIISNSLSGLVCIPKNLKKANSEKTFPASTGKCLLKTIAGSMFLTSLPGIQYKSSGGYNENKKTIL